MKYNVCLSKKVEHWYLLSGLPLKIWAISIVILNLFCFSESSAQPTRTMNAAELELALKKLNVLGSVLYIAAHPDDENNALLSYLSSERLLRTAYLSTTRGDGGQNLIGSEKGALMGVIRTQELLAARRIDGAEQFFTRAIDFGYSKTPEEAIRIWGEDAIVSDMVWIIRNFRPDVIITRFAPEFGGHGHHRASAILAEKAFHAAGNPSIYPDQLEYVDVWQPKRMVWNAWSRAVDPADAEDMVQVDVGKYNSLLGKSYTEISAKSRSMHKSQGFGAGGRRGQSPEYFQHTAGQRAIRGLFEGIDISWNRVDGGNAVSSAINEAIAAFQGDNPASIIPHLLRIREAIDALSPGYWKSQKQSELQKIILSAAGLWTEAIADDFSAVPGGQIDVTINVVNRSDFPLKLHSIVLPFAKEANVVGLALPENQPFEKKVSVALPEELEISQPYWLESKGSLGLFRVEDQEMIGQPEAPPLLIRIVLSAGNQLLEVKTPLLYRWVDRVEGELYRPVEIVPDVAINLDKDLYVFANEQSREIGVKLKAGRSNVTGTLRLRVPENWHVDPASVKFILTEKDEESLLFFSVIPPESASKETIRAEAILDSKTVSRGRATIDYSHIPIRTLFPPAEADLLRLDITIHDEEIAYIMGSGDDVPSSLEQLGYHITSLSDEDLENGDLQQFDTIIAGIRAYNTRASLRHYQARLLDFVFSGGTLIVQYNTSRDVLVDNLGPFPMELSRDRVSVENAPVKMVIPAHPLLNVPNKITPADFEGWVQERGLYFADQWDSRYDAPLSSHDPGETEKLGSLLYCRYGEGVFIYTGLSWFRELPAGVPGAFRLFVNMISAGKSSGSETN